ncbi:MAG: DUF98 domain-containing protein [Methanomicrobiaceae archaeon]|nr:DUF98 domain-containing protein [Methanomicrobiaceae archaeon]MDD5420399.1 beta-ribofuranosylaminobenzene 5'-phosphate synthase [Methanomicrobiaceae archaeon]
MKTLTPGELARVILDLEQEAGGLSPVQKVLLGTDGSVTNLLEMVTGNPVEITTLVQEVVQADADVAESLDIEAGEPVNYRVVELKDGRTGDVLIYAVSHTPLKRLAPEFRQDLMRADIPIGRILRTHRIESRREILHARMLRADANMSRIFSIQPEEALLSRKYRIIHREEPLIAIEETFPRTAFADAPRVLVDAPSRLHLGLIDLNGSLGRVDGGIGIALDHPGILLEARHESTVLVQGGDEESRRRVEEAARAVLGRLGISSGAAIRLQDTVPHHVGLGSGTQLALAAARAVCELYGKAVSVRYLAGIVGRGGTSGIGTAAFEAGGFIVDGGHRFGQPGGKEDFRPSAASRGISPAPVIARHPFPDDWKILLVTPAVRKGAHGGEEVDLFRAHCPVSLAEVRKLCHEVLMRMLPAVIEQDLDIFGSSVNRIQNLGFKRFEIAGQPPLIPSLMSALCEAGAACAGMSSFGPTVYAVGDSGMREVERAAGEALDGMGGTILLTTARNSGATIKTG